MSGSSFDCLLGEPNASMTAWLCLSFGPPLVLWFLTMIYVVGKFMRAQVSGMEVNLTLVKNTMKASIVCTNCFLPDMVASLARFFPCIHFQDNGNKYLQFDVEKMCDNNILLMRAATMVVASLLGFVLVPWSWVTVIKMSEREQWDDSKEVLGFLTTGYRNKVL